MCPRLKDFGNMTLKDIRWKKRSHKNPDCDLHPDCSFTGPRLVLSVELRVLLKLPCHQKIYLYYSVMSQILSKLNYFNSIRIWQITNCCSLESWFTIPISPPLSRSIPCPIPGILLMWHCLQSRHRIDQSQRETADIAGNIFNNTS